MQLLVTVQLHGLAISMIKDTWKDMNVFDGQRIRTPRAATCREWGKLIPIIFIIYIYKYAFPKPGVHFQHGTRQPARLFSYVPKETWSIQPMWASSWWPRKVPWPPRHGSVQRNVKVPMIWRHPSRCLPSMSLGLHSFRRIVWWHEYMEFQVVEQVCLKVVQVFLKWASDGSWDSIIFIEI